MSSGGGRRGLSLQRLLSPSAGGAHWVSSWITQLQHRAKMGLKVGAPGSVAWRAIRATGVSKVAEAVCRVRTRAQVRAGEHYRLTEKARPETKEEYWSTVVPWKPKTASVSRSRARAVLPAAPESREDKRPQI